MTLTSSQADILVKAAASRAAEIGIAASTSGRLKAFSRSAPTVRFFPILRAALVAHAAKQRAIKNI
jgi:hypothetical protein